MRTYSTTTFFDKAPGLLLASLFPLIMHMKLADVSMLTSYPWYPSSDTRPDFFLYYRNLFFIGLCIFMLFVLMDRIFLRQKCAFRISIFWPLLGYTTLVLCSSIFSSNHALSFQGMVEQYENIWALLGYAVTTWYFYELCQDKSSRKLFASALLISCAIACILGIFQFMGIDFFNTVLGKFLLISSSNSAYRESISFSFGSSLLHRVYMTFYNPNYAGVYLVLVFPIAGLFFYQSKNKRVRFSLAILMIIMLICLIGCGSKSAWGVLVFLLLVMLLLFLRFHPRAFKKILIATVLLVIAFVICDFATGHTLSWHMEDTLSSKAKPYMLKDVAVGKDAVFITYGDQPLSMAFVSDNSTTLYLAVKDKDGIPLQLVYNEKKEAYQLGQAYFKKLYFYLYEKNGIPFFAFSCRDTVFTFTKDPITDGYTYITLFGKPDTIENAYSIFPESMDTWLTSRGYIWGRTIPLLRNYMLIGSGPDTFATVFPQNDYYERAHTGARCYSEILTKPHNMYLQTALQTGVLSLIFLLIFWGKYLKSALRALFRNDPDPVQLALTLSILGYLLMGILNDSMLVTAPLFWAMLGTGMAVNKKLI